MLAAVVTAEEVEEVELDKVEDEKYVEVILRG